MSQTKPKKEKQPDPFIEYLEENRDDHAIMSSLRRGLAQPRCVEVSRIVQRRLSEGAPRWLEDAYYAVGPLFALHHAEMASAGNMGDHFRALCNDPDDPPASVERRFMHLLASEAVDLDDALRQAVSLLKSKEIAVNWRQLLDDVKWWKQSETSRDIVRQSWAQQFWRTRRKPDPSTNQENS